MITYYKNKMMETKKSKDIEIPKLCPYCGEPFRKNKDTWKLVGKTWKHTCKK